MIALPLDVVDAILLEYHVGHVLLIAFVLAILGSLPLKSTKVLSLNLVLFGLVFVLTPTSALDQNVFFRLAGIGLLVVGPMLFVMARR